MVQEFGNHCYTACGLWLEKFFWQNNSKLNYQYDDCRLEKWNLKCKFLPYSAYQTHLCVSHEGQYARHGFLPAYQLH